MNYKYLLRVNQHFHTWVDAPRGLDAAIDMVAYQYSMDYGLSDGQPITVDVLNTDGIVGADSLPEEVARSVEFYVSLEVKRKKGQ